jgi:ATP diphosphatase
LGYDFSSSDGVLSRLDDELNELSRACENHDPEEIENELGDVLFTVVNLARHLKVDAEASLRKANRRFEQRVRRAESAAIDAGSRLQDESVERLEERWSAAKAEERKDNL